MFGKPPCNLVRGLGPPLQYDTIYMCKHTHTRPELEMRDDGMEWPNYPDVLITVNNGNLSVVPPNKWYTSPTLVYVT